MVTVPREHLLCCVYVMYITYELYILGLIIYKVYSLYISVLLNFWVLFLNAKMICFKKWCH